MSCTDAPNRLATVKTACFRGRVACLVAVLGGLAAGAAWAEGTELAPPRTDSLLFSDRPSLDWPVTPARTEAESDAETRPVAVPLSPVLLPAAAVLGWAMLRKRRRHP